MIIELTRGKKTIVDDTIPSHIFEKRYSTSNCGGKYYASTNLIGLFSSAEEASVAYIKLAKKIFGKYIKI